MKETKENLEVNRWAILTFTTSGITLIALVITIIVLLILAGVTINLTIGNNGMFKTAQQAAKNYTDAQDKELAELNEFDNVMKDIIEEQNWSEPYTTTVKYNYTDQEGNKATIPAGFQVSLKAGETTVKEGLVIRNAKDKNEFVWVPVEGMEYTYDRYDFKRQSVSYSNYSETKPSDEETSVTAYGGYYIGRYEAGITSATERSSTDKDTNKTAEEIEEISGKAISQAEKHTYNYVTRDQAKGLAERVYTKAEDNVTSKLCSSYAWDTTLKFIDSNPANTGYITNMEVGNYSVAVGGTGELQRTGYYSVNNIYDMGGNSWEWTTEEVYSDADTPFVRRGGGYTSSNSPASSRYSGDSKSLAGGGTAFRFALFI